MAGDVVLYVGRVGGKEDNFVETLQKRYAVHAVSSGKQALDFLQVTPAQLIILNAASMRTPGERVCRQLRAHAPRTPIIHIIPENVGQIESPAELLLSVPFTARKLQNSAERLLKARGDEIIQCGPFQMNIPQRMLSAHGHETQLSPKVALLVEMFLRNPNTTFDRAALMEHIWQTDYLGDTRTLDVHIRWARQVLENGGGHRYLRTVRGIGYRLELPSPVEAAETTVKAARPRKAAPVAQPILELEPV